jgi:hypothetical protein
VPRLRLISPIVVAVHSTADSLDELEVPEGATLCRVAPREALLVGSDAGDVSTSDPEGIVEDVSDGWAGFELSGDGADEAFARLSELELPDEGFLQGEVARVGAKVIVSADRLTILVPAMLGAFVEERIRTDCAEVLW